MNSIQPTTKHIYLAGGCFWGTEHYLKQIRGIVHTETGYANGIVANPTYEMVCTDKTQFAETVHVEYDPELISLKTLLQLYFKAIDPVSVNQQGHDKGTQYRTGIYYVDAADLPVIEEVYASVQSEYEQPLAVEKQPMENFYSAEEYHQDYLDKNPDGYCHLPVELFEFARKANRKKKVYFAGSIRGGRVDASLYQKIIAYIQKTAQVLTEHVGNPQLSVYEQGTDKDTQIYEQDMGWLRQSELLIAECTCPSLGVGYELASAEGLGIPCHIFYDKSKCQLSAMLTGNSYFHIHPYQSEAEIYPILDKILK